MTNWGIFTKSSRWTNKRKEQSDIEKPQSLRGGGPYGLSGFQLGEAGGRSSKSEIQNSLKKTKKGMKVKGLVISDYYRPTHRPWAPRKDLPQ